MGYLFNEQKKVVSKSRYKKNYRKLPQYVKQTKSIQASINPKTAQLHIVKKCNYILTFLYRRNKKTKVV